MINFHVIRVLNKKMVENYRRGIGPTKFVLLLTTTGRKSGLPRTTPLQFEEVDGSIIVGSARGKEADWVKNVRVNPYVQVQIGRRVFDANAETVLDAQRIADFIELRVRRHPIMLRFIMFIADGLPPNFNRQQLEQYCMNRVMVRLHPIG